MATVTLLILCLAWKTRADSSADLISISKRRFQNGGGPSQPITQPITVALSLPSDAANGASSSYHSYYGPTGGDDFLTPTAARQSILVRSLLGFKHQLGHDEYCGCGLPRVWRPNSHIQSM